MICLRVHRRAAVRGGAAAHDHQADAGRLRVSRGGDPHARGRGQHSPGPADGGRRRKSEPLDGRLAASSVVSRLPFLVVRARGKLEFYFQIYPSFFRPAVRQKNFPGEIGMLTIPLPGVVGTHKTALFPKRGVPISCFFKTSVKYSRASIDERLMRRTQPSKHRNASLFRRKAPRAVGERDKSWTSVERAMIDGRHASLHLIFDVKSVFHSTCTNSKFSSITRHRRIRNL